MIRKKYSLYILLLGSIPTYIHAMEVPEETIKLKTNYTRAELYKAFSQNPRWWGHHKNAESFLKEILESNPELANEVFPLKNLCNETLPDLHFTPLAASIHCDLQPSFDFLLSFCLPGSSKPLVNINHIFNEDTEPNSALLVAIRLQRYLMAKILIDHGAWVNIPQTHAGLFKLSPLEIADDPQIKTLLLASGAKKKHAQLMYTAEDLFNAIFPHGWERPFDSSVDMQTDHILLVKNILHTNPELASTVFQEINLTPLAATVRANLESLFKFLLAYRHPENDEPIVEVNQIFGSRKDPNTALLEAIRLARISMVEELVRYGAWVNIPEGCLYIFQFTPLQEALVASHAMVTLLIKAGAKPISPASSCIDIKALSSFIDLNRPAIAPESLGAMKELELYISPPPTPASSPLAKRKSDEDVNKGTAGK